MASPVSITVNGANHVDFKSATVTLSMETIASGFSFEFSDKWLRSNLGQMPFHTGDPVQVLLHGKKVIDGYISSLPISYDANSHSIGVTGRSWTGHLIDCSAVHKTGSWRNATLLVIARDLCEPFGITVKADDPSILAELSQPFPRWAIEDEETVAECLRRAAKMRALFMMTDSGKNLIFTRASKLVQPGELKYGKNILQASRDDNFDERFSYYLVKSQNAGTDTWYADNAGKGFFRVDDPEVASFRPMIIMSDGQGRRPDLEKRAKWERNTRAGRSRRITYTVRGFRNEVNSQRWPVNELIAVDDPLLDTKDSLLIISAQFTYSTENGEKTQLVLGAPQQFDVLAPEPPKPKGRKKKKISW